MMRWPGVLTSLRSRFRKRAEAWVIPLCAGMALVMLVMAVVMHLRRDDASEWGGRAVPLYAVMDVTESLTLEAFRQGEWGASPEVWELRSQLSEKPYWLGISRTVASPPGLSLLQFESKHIVALRCYAGHGTGVLPVEFKGFNWVLKFDPATVSQVDCRVRFMGPAVLHVYEWPDGRYEQYIGQLASKRNFAEGCYFAMMLLAALVAFSSRQRIFLTYLAWLFFSSRALMTSNGWDYSFMDIAVPRDYLYLIRMVVFTGLYASIVGLTHELFPVFSGRRFIAFRWSCHVGLACLLGFALFGDYSAFLRVLWPLSLYTAALIVFVALSNLRAQRGGALFCYVMGVFGMVPNTVGEVFLAWLDVRILWDLVSNTTLYLMSSGMIIASVLEVQRIARQQRDKAVEQVSNAQERMATLFELAPSAMFSCDASGRFTSVNSTFKTLADMHADSPARFDFLSANSLSDLFSKVLLHGDKWVAQYRHYNRHADVRWYELQLSVHAQEMIGAVRDITSEKDKEAELHFQATHDALTGALNRRGLEHLLNALRDRGVEQLGLVCLDLRKYKLMVKAHGATVAERVLVAFYGLLYRHLFTYGDIVRYGNDQFLVVVSDPDHAEGLMDSLQHLGGLLRSKALPAGGVQLWVDVQMASVHLLLKQVEAHWLSLLDDMLLELKYRLRQSDQDLVVFSEKESFEMLNQCRIGEQISANVLPANLVLHWQPIVSLRFPATSLYAEALLRMRGEAGEVLPAGFVIEGCQNRGKTSLLDMWVLRQIIDHLEEHALELTGLHTVGVNVSPNSLNDEAFLKEALSALTQHPSAACKLCLEITEIGSILNHASVKRFVQQVRSLGVKIALDDFGSGFSNFQYVLDLQADVIKIDGTIAGKVCTSPESRAVVNAVVSMASDLGCTVVAEWVEDLYALHELRDLGVDYAQGFVIGKAMAAREFLGRSSCLELIADAEVHAVLSLCHATERHFGLTG